MSIGEWSHLHLRPRLIQFPAALLAGSAICLLLGVAQAVPAPSFPDVPSNHPYAVAIQDLAERGIISGFDDGSFGPDLEVARQQFAKMIVLSLGLPVREADMCPFDDVEVSGPTGLYPDNYVAVCAQAGITLGTAPGLFSPYLTIPRCQVITMVVRAVDSLHPGLLAKPPAGYAGTWGDFDPTHAPFACAAEYNGLLAVLGADAPHPDGHLAGLTPYGHMPRGEVAQILHNLLMLLESHASTTTNASTTTTEPQAPQGELLHFWWKWGDECDNWEVESISAITQCGQISAERGLNSHEPTTGFSYEYLFAPGADGDLLLFQAKPGRHDWQVTNVSGITGRKVAAICDGDVQFTGRGTTETMHIVCRDQSNNLIHFWWRKGQTWAAQDVSTMLGRQIKGRPTFFVDETVDDGSRGYAVAATGLGNEVLLFHMDDAGHWRVEDVTAPTGLTSGGFFRWDSDWSDRPGGAFRGVIGVLDADGHFQILERSVEGAPWKTTDLSAIVDERFQLNHRLLVWTYQDYTGERDLHFAGVNPGSDLVHFWRDAGGDWHKENISDAIGEDLAGLSSYSMATLGGKPAHFLFVQSPDGRFLSVWRELPRGTWHVTDVSLGADSFVYPWSIPAPTGYDGFEHALAVGILE